MDQLSAAVASTSIPETSFSARQFLQSLPAAVYTCDSLGYVIEYNQAAVELWGREPEIGKDLWCGSWKIFRNDGSSLPLEECPMAIALKESRPVHGKEIVIQRPDGSFRNVAPHPQPIYDDSGKVIGAVNMLLDITERKASEKSVARLAAIVQTSDDGIISKNLDGIITSWNDAAQRIFGYESSEMIGMPVTTLMPPDRINEEPRILERLRRGERVDHFETKRVTKDGRLLDISLTISPIKDNEGNVIGASKIVRDITSQIEMQRRIRENEERFRMAVSATRLGTWEYAPGSGDLKWSDECRKIYDLPDNIPISFELFAELLYPDDASLALNAINSAMDPDGNGDYDIEFRVVRYTDKAVRWIRSQGKVFFTAEGAPEKFIGTVLDITDEKESKEALERKVQERTRALKRSNQSLLRSNSELEQFAYVASHDLQEPLRKIQTFTDRLESKAKGALSEELQVYIQKIANSSRKMSVLIRDLLDYARIDRREDQFRLTDLNEILESVRDDLDLVISGREATIIADELPVIEALPLQMRQLFYNLINNSLKFASTGRSLVLSIVATELNAAEKLELDLNTANSYFKIEFKDNGIGFSNEYAVKIFTIFQRLNTTNEYPGTGIGLALCKKVVNNHSGLIYAAGVENVGASFTIILPGSQHVDEQHIRN